MTEALWPQALEEVTLHAGVSGVDESCSNVLYAARPRLDVVSTLLARRMWNSV